MPACKDIASATSTSDELLADLGASLADGTTAKRIRYFTRPDLLIIDGFGFDRIEREQSPQGLSLVYKVIDRRGSQRSTALITNIDFDAWKTSNLHDGPLVMALLDRLFEKAIIKRFPKAKSYRAHQGERYKQGRLARWCILDFFGVHEREDV